MLNIALIKPPKLAKTFRGGDYYSQHLAEYLSQKLTGFNPLKHYDLVHFPYFDPFFFTLPPVRFSKTVVTVHDLIPLKYPEHFPLGKRAKITWPIQKKLLQNVDAVITDSKASQGDIAKIIGLPDNRIHVVPLAADKIFKPLKNIQNNLHLPPKFAMFVGGVNWNKNVISLINACQQAKIPLVLVGLEFLAGKVNLRHVENRPLQNILTAIDKNPLFIRLGFVETQELVDVYNLASVYVQPSIDEGFGLPILEAMGCGTPVICGKNGSLPEVAGDAATYADVEDVNDLAEKISHVKKTGREISQAAKFSWKITAQKTYEIYKLLGSRDPGVV